MKEANYWADVAADVMSDEEQVGISMSGTHVPYSEAFHKFVEKLDQRCTRQKSSQPRKGRELGSPREFSVPSNAKKKQNRQLKKDYKGGGDEIDPYVQDKDDSESD